MDRHSRSPDLADGRRYGRRRRHSRSYSRSRSRDRSRERRRRYSRSISRERVYRRGGANSGGSPDMSNQDYDDYRDNGNGFRYKNDRNERRDRRDRRDRYYHRGRGHSSDSSNDSFANEHVNYRNQTPTNKIIILGLAKHLTEADIKNDLIYCGIQPASICLIRKRKTGTSRGFAFVEFNTEEEASRWMEYKQGVLLIQDQYRAVMQYSMPKDFSGKDRIVTDWYCAKCGVFNFKRRDNCFKCNASREESEKGGEGSDEVSSILTKKIMLRNLDVLTNEEGVLTSMQEVVPELVSKISKILICRDPLTSTSRGICYLSFDNLVDSMNTYNALKALEPPLKIDNRDILITYCVDMENRQLNAQKNNGNKFNNDSNQSSGAGSSSHQYTLADVPRLAEYSASVYANNSAEHDYYYNYYTDYYVEQINNGEFNSLPSMTQMSDTANSGAAVALSAIQRKLQKQYGKQAQVSVASTTAIAPVVLQIPNGSDGRKYPTPNVSQYQYEESSGYYYDPTTGLYYDPNSQYYYNSEIASYLYWDQEKSTYILAAQSDGTTSTSTNGTEKTVSASTKTNSTAANIAQPQTIDSSDTKDTDGKKNDQKHDKVKVAKKIVKDMEKWAKQLNQKKDMNAFQALQPPAAVKEEETPTQAIARQQPLQRMTSGYADVGFAILENRDGRTATQNKVLPTYTSDSDNEQNEHQSYGELNDKELVDFEKLACMLCKRAFQSLEILNKHIKMSTLHKENLQKHKLSVKSGLNSGYGSASDSSSSYRDRAKERRLKYGEADPPPANRSRERFEKEMRKQTAQLQKQASNNLATMPIGENNVGNRLLQKMGWSEGQGLGRSNQGRTKIIEAETRAPSAGLGTKKTTSFVPGDDYRTYIKRMMKSRYEQAE